MNMEASNESVMYIIINQGCKMGKGKIGSQCAHGACEVTRILEREKRFSYYEGWLRNCEPKVVLKAPEEVMERLIQEYPYSPAKIESLWCISIRDQGRTQVKPNSLTAIAFRPIMRKLVPPILTSLKLL